MHGLGADVERDLDGAGWQRVHEIREQLCRNGDRAFILDLRRDPAVHADLEIRRSELQSSTVGLEEHIPQDGERPPRRDPAANDRQTAREVLLQTADLQTGPSTSSYLLID